MTAADGSGSNALTDPSAVGRAPKGIRGSSAVGEARWSPDGSSIRFTTSPEDPAEPTPISTIKPDGADRTDLGEINEADAEALRRGAMSPDGSRVAFAETNPQTGADLYTMNADGSDRQLLAHGPGRVFDPSWSPDGRKIAFTSDAEPQAINATQIEVINADGANRHVLTAVDHDRDLSTTSWSPDGRWISALNVKHDTGAFLLTLVRSDGSQQHSLTQRPSYAELAPSWAPDGLIAFVDGNGIRVASPEATDGVCLTGHGRNEQPVWSPDGTKIAFLREAS